MLPLLFAKAVLFFALLTVRAEGWTTVVRDSKISYDLETHPLQITTLAPANGDADRVHVS